MRRTNDRKRICLGLAALLGALPAAASAQPATATPADTLSLSDAEKADLLSHHTEASVDAARAGLGDAVAPPSVGSGIHGEIGGLIGSHGTRAAYGVASVPLGQDSRATVSFESDRTRYPR